MSSSEDSDGYHSAEDELTLSSSQKTAGTFSSDTRSVEAFGIIPAPVMSEESNEPSFGEDDVDESSQGTNQTSSNECDSDSVPCEDDGKKESQSSNTNDSSCSTDCEYAYIQHKDISLGVFSPPFAEGWEIEDPNIIEDLDVNKECRENVEAQVESLSLPEIKSPLRKTEKILNEDSVNSPGHCGPDAYEEEDTQHSWSNWGRTWGVTSIISRATESVCTITQGLTSAIETGLGAPEPEKLAQSVTANLNIEESSNFGGFKQRQLDAEKKSSVIEGIFGGVSQIGSKVINTGLDTLETLGKKTMEVLQEGDPGLKKKRALFITDNKPKLSEILKEAQTKHDSSKEENSSASRSTQFDKLFDDMNGLIHLEALEMVAQQCNLKIEIYLQECDNEKKNDIDDTFEKIKEIGKSTYYDDDDKIEAEEFNHALISAVKNLGVSIMTKKLVEVSYNITNEEILSENQHVTNIHRKAITSLARFTALSMEMFHRLCENLMLKENRRPELEAVELFKIMLLIIVRINTIGEWYTNNIIKLQDTHAHITDIFLEVANSVSYINNVYKSLLPVLQVGALNT